MSNVNKLLFLSLKEFYIQFLSRKNQSSAFFVHLVTLSLRKEAEGRRNSDVKRKQTIVSMFRVTISSYKKRAYKSFGKATLTIFMLESQR